MQEEVGQQDGGHGPQRACDAGGPGADAADPEGEQERGRDGGDGRHDGSPADGGVGHGFPDGPAQPCVQEDGQARDGHGPGGDARGGKGGHCMVSP